MLASRFIPSLAMPRRLGFDRFVLLSGCGWLLDTGMLLSLTHFGLLPTNVANVLSSATAATVVFVVARHWVHAGASDRLAFRLGLYLLYTAIVILLASLAIGLIDARLAPRLSAFGIGWSSVLIAKIIITPPQLICNFWVSRYFARFAVRSRDS